MISPLLDSRYRKLYAAQVVALAGTGLSTIALTLLAYELAGGGAGTVLGTALALKILAYVGVAPIIGGLVHRLPRRRLLVSLDVARAGFVMCLPFVTEIWEIYLLILLINACSAGFTPVFQATVPDILTDRAQYTRALSLSRLAYDLENLLSPMLAAAALVVLSYDALFAANAVTFLISAVLILCVQLPTPGPQEGERGVWENAVFGVRAYLATPRLRGLLALSFSVAAAGAMVIVNTVVYVRDRLGGTESDTAMAFAAAGAGSLLVALVLPRLLDRRPDRPFMVGGGVLLAAGLMLGLSEPGLLALLLIWFVLGSGSSLIQTPAGRLLQQSANAGDRPAIFAAQFALSHACWLVTYPLAGWIGSSLGLTTAFAALGAITLASTAIAVAVWPVADSGTLEHEHEPMTHVHFHVHDEHHQHPHDGSEGPPPHRHPHRHRSLKHKHAFVIDLHHPVWPTR